MRFIELTQRGAITSLVLGRGKVNALTGEVIEELDRALENLEESAETEAVILTGRGKFFSFGFDIPHFLDYPRDEFRDFLVRFTDLYTRLFLYPKPVVAALNGHTIAGGCMLALACDRRVMVSGRSKISLNEITFGSSVFAGSVEMLRFCLGSRAATDVLYSGKMYSGEEAMAMGLVDETTPESSLAETSRHHASELADNAASAFADIKRLLREPVAKTMRLREAASIESFVEIWYQDHTRRNLKGIRIY